MIYIIGIEDALSSFLMVIWDGQTATYYKLNSILRRHYGFIMTASWEKIYSVLGGVAIKGNIG